MDGLTRRDAVQRVMALMGGLALAGGDRLDAMSLDAWPFDAAAFDQAMAQGVGAFTAADVALLDEIADTILPTTSTPGAKAAKTGAFMALMVTDVYVDAHQRVFTDGLRTLEAACRAATGGSFMQATPVQRVALLEGLDREQKTATEEQTAPARTRFPATPVPETAPLPHYFRMMKELALLGYFTSEIGYTKALRYIESPGRFEPDVPLAPGDRSWAPHS
jgi:Gluconate 2-dehydrogenase subunit 3